VQGNFIGIDVSGSAVPPHTTSFLGLAIIGDASDNTIGGTTAGARNVISGANGYGISMGRFGTTALPARNLVEGNFIGTDATGTKPLGNQGSGVVVDGLSNTVGGLTAGAGNVIAYNHGTGVAVGDGTGNAILGNTIFSNQLLGIDLANDVTSEDHPVLPNDLDDPDIGANNLQNYPVLTSAASSDRSTTIAGAINTTPNMGILLQFYANDTADPSGYGEGQTYLGSSFVKTDAAGNAAFSANFPATVAVGKVVTATATDWGQNTSEFSKAVPVTAKVEPPPLPDVTPPTVVAFQRLGSYHQPTRLLLTFSEPINTAGALQALNYIVITSGPDGRLGTSDDALVPLKALSYDAGTRTLQLTTARPLSRHRPSQLTVQPLAITDKAGNVLDGAHNGRPGSLFRVVFGGSTPAQSRAARAIRRV
jgi:hypothetical protein